VAGAPLVVVGAGMAGTAAAFAAASAGAQVIVVHDRAGASALSSGALDREPWDGEPGGAGASRRDEAANDEELRGFIGALGVYRLPAARAAESGLIATQAGIVRACAGADDALLELAALAGRRIAVADVERDDWDAPLLARTLSASPWAERSHTTFVPVAVRLLRVGSERRIAPYDFASLHDDPARRSALAEALKAASGGVDAWLVGPWLGLDPETVKTLRTLVPLPLGETTSLMGGPAGARFERARDRLLAARGIELRQARVVSVARRGARWMVELAGEDDGTSAGRVLELEARAVVLATGGVGAGGIRLTWEPARVSGFELPFRAPVSLGLDGEALGGGGSLFGPSLETLGLGVLERVGIRADALGRPVGQNPEETGLFVAGDAVMGQSRTMFRAALAGLAAGNVAARG
jgi:hypothetical protein